jgi:hypothetical protein
MSNLMTLNLALDWGISHTDGRGDPIAMTHELTPIDNRYAYETVSTMQVPCITSVHVGHASEPPCACASTY